MSNIIQTLNLEKVSFPEPFERSTVEPIMKRIFTNNPYHWSQANNYILIGKNPLWFVEKWIEQKFEIYRGELPFTEPDFSRQDEASQLSESAARWSLMWEWSRARHALLPLIYWNADTWLSRHGFQLDKTNATSTEMLLRRIQVETELEEFDELQESEDLETFENEIEYCLYRTKREDREWDEFVRVRCGEFKAEQVYFNWGSNFLVFPFPNEDDLSLECYYLKFIQCDKDNR